MAAYLGLDIGATRARWVVLDDEREVCAGEEPSALAEDGGTSSASARLTAQLQRICRECDVVAGVAGVAGVSDPGLRRSMIDAVAQLPLTITGDPEVAAAAALSAGAGVALWSGTGSFAVARDEAGRLHRVGGRGPLLGDEGGALVMVRRAAAAVVRAADGLAEATALQQPLVEHFGAPGPEHLGAAMQKRSRAAQAAALSLVVRAAAAADPAAVRVLEEGAAALVDLAGAAARRSALASERFPLVLGGGVIERCEELAARVVERARARGFGEVMRAARSGAHGAALLARARHLELAPLCTWGRDAPA